MENVINNNAPRVESNAPRVESEFVNVVINFASPEAREAEARALNKREADADAASKRRKLAADLLASSRENFNAARDDEKAAKIAAARSRFAAGSENASDCALLSVENLLMFGKSVFTAAAAARAAVMNSEAGKAATKAIREESRSTSLSRGCRDLLAMLDYYNALFSLFGFTLDASEISPALMKADAVTPFLLAPTADGARVATLQRGKLSPVTDWNAARVADVLIDNQLIAAAVEAAPRAALLEALAARDNVATLQSDADEIAATLEAREARAAGLQRTIKNPKARPETKARAAADLEALRGEIAEYKAKQAKALEALRDAKAKAASSRAAALEAAEIAAADFDVIASRRDVFNNAKADAAAAFIAAAVALKNAVTFAAAEARKQKKAINFDALKKADPLKIFDAASIPADDAKMLEAARVFAADDFEKAAAAARAAASKAKAREAARDAESVIIAESIKADPAAKYRALLDVACNALKAARDAKAKKAKAADVKATPEISDAEFIAISDASDAADAEAAAALEALNAESPAPLMLEASNARAAAVGGQRKRRQPRKPASIPADAGSQPAAAAV